MKLMIKFCLLLLCFSCQQFKSEPVEAIVAKETRQINWQSIDQLPKFSACDQSVDESQIECFQKAMYQSIKLDSLISTHSNLKTDSLQLQIIITKSGHFQLESIKTKNTGQIQILNEKLKMYFAALEPIQPAYKRGIPVDLRLSIPVIIK
ncbi:hypothetical protein IMZ30_07210 [Psychroflexus sp. ALD_RP9]|nr:hypothetical protein IMZ30_07210 [Psychroflexus sp. ALD_RP9]